MKKAKIFENLSLKILAVFFSLLLWLIVVNVSDPVIDISYSDIPLQVTNADSITGEGKVYEITSAGTVTISVSAKRSILDSLSVDNFKAVVDLSLYNEETGTVPVRVESNKYSDRIESMKSKTETVNISVEDMLRKQFTITPVVSGDPEDGFVLGDVTTAENIVRISGAESVVSSIKSVTAEVSVAGLNSSINTSVDLRLYDEEGNQIKDTNLTKNISTVAVSAQILATKELELRFSVSGELADGYSLAGALTANAEAVLVAGKASVLNSIDTLDIPATAINVEGQSSTMTVTLDLAKYLPDGVTLVDKEDAGKVTVEVPIEANAERTFTIAKENIEITGLPEELFAELLGTTDSIEVEVTGLVSVISKLMPADVSAQLDLEAYMEQQELTALKSGTIRVPVSLTLPEGVTATRDTMVNVRLSETEE